MPYYRLTMACPGVKCPNNADHASNWSHANAKCKNTYIEVNE